MGRILQSLSQNTTGSFARNTLLRSGVFFAIISSLSAQRAVAEFGVLWAADPGASSTLYELDSRNGNILGSLTGSFVRADALSFANDGNSIWTLDRLTGNANWVDLAGNLLQSVFIGPDPRGITVLPDDKVAVSVSNVVYSMDPNTGSLSTIIFSAEQLFGLATNGIDRVFALANFGVIYTYDLFGNLLNFLPTAASGETTGLAYAGTSFFIASVGGSIQEVDAQTGELTNIFAGPSAFALGLDFLPGAQVPPEVPEPASIVSLAIGGAFAGLLFSFRRRNRNTARLDGPSAAEKRVSRAMDGNPLNRS